jgi:ATPase subunit of ABC transporter with duplicated ATPase domains
MSQTAVQLVNLHKSFNTNLLFDDISMSINKKDCIALIGENGAGKSTLLKILSKEESQDEGQIFYAPGLRIGFLRQQIDIVDPSLTVRGFIESKELKVLEISMQEKLEAGLLLEWADLHEEYERLGGYQRVPIEKVLNGLKLADVVLDTPMNCLSSGEKVRVALAKCLIDNPDLLLLDEPTNHLDQQMLDYLKTMLLQRQGATLIVSHDRAFLNATCNNLIELHRGKLIRYKGNYNAYLIEKEQNIQRQIQRFEEQAEEKRILKEKIKAMHFSKKAGAVISDRDVLGYNNRGSNHEKSVSRRLNDLKMKLEKLELNPIAHPRAKSITGLLFSNNPTPPGILFELQQIQKSYDSKMLFSNFSKQVYPKQRIIITGKNGAGKSTLLKIIQGLIQPDSGRVRYSEGVKIALLEQEMDPSFGGQSVVNYFCDRFSLLKEDLVRKLHQLALAEGSIIHQPINCLSEGQKKRLMLLDIILQNPNVLLLDEPTNHLDLTTLEALENAINHFEGAVIAVSHDTTFINKIGGEKWNL